MHIDIAHALVSSAIILVVLLILAKKGHSSQTGKWNWTIFFSVFVVMAIFNLIWPYGS